MDKLDQDTDILKVERLLSVLSLWYKLGAHLVSILGGQAARLLELDLGHHAGLHVVDLHDPCVLNVDLAHDQVVDR